MIDTQSKILGFVSANNKVKPVDLVRHLGLSRVRVHTWLKRLVEQGILKREGSSPQTYYSLAKNENEASQIADKIKPILVRYGVTRAQLFGSAARGELRPDSDIDILVKFPPQAGLFTVGQLYGDLKKTLGRDVDLVSYNAVHPYIQKQVYSSVVDVL